MKTKPRKYKVIRMIGVSLLVLGVALVILQLMAGEKSVIGSIAAGATPITMGALLVGVTFRIERKEAPGDPSDPPK